MLFYGCFLLFSTSFGQGPYASDSIKSDFVLTPRRLSFDKHMRENTIDATFREPVSIDNEDQYREACWAISQFLLRSENIANGFTKLFAAYPHLALSTKRAFLEAVYAAYPSEYGGEMGELLVKEINPKLFSMQALYIARATPAKPNKQSLLALTEQLISKSKNKDILIELKDYLQNHDAYQNQSIPDLNQLFAYQQFTGKKIIYSFQRWNRDFPGLAVIQNADGHFVRDSSGNLLIFEQLARAASNLPYFITNGNSPQGVYSIQGTEVSHNLFIGPTPNIQLVMPNERDSSFWHTPYDSSKDVLANYLDLLPESWRNYHPITESFFAGKVGRTEVIAHGTTIDPEYFSSQPFYPLTPTMGCLCSRELWNSTDGKAMQSDQLRMVNAFLSTPDDKGFLIVINLDNQPNPVNRAELEKLVADFEQGQQKRDN